MSCSPSSVGAVEAVEAAIDLRRWSSWYKGAKTITARCHTDVCGRRDVFVCLFPPGSASLYAMLFCRLCSTVCDTAKEDQLLSAFPHN